jgi:hypothetical protein
MAQRLFHPCGTSHSRWRHQICLAMIHVGHALMSITFRWFRVLA